MRITTELTNKEIEDALSKGGDDIKILWEVYSSLEGDEEFNKSKDQVKYGTEHLFDIRLITKGYYEELPHWHLVKIGRKQRLFIYEFWNEIERRKNIMKKALRSIYNPEFDNQTEQEIEGYGEE